MPDEDLRALERRARASGSVADEAEWLAARVRVGQLGESNLRLAAYLSHPAAIAALGDEAPARELDDPAEWARSLAHWGLPVLARSASIAARSVLPRWESARPDDARPRRALEAVEAWLESPDAERATAARHAGRTAFDARHETTDEVARSAASSVAQVALGLDADDNRLGHAVSAAVEVSWHEAHRVAAGSLVPREELIALAGPVRELVAAGMIGWALSESPPLDVTRWGPRPRRYLTLGQREWRELAAWLGDDSARAALGRRAPRVPRAFVPWCEGLHLWGGECLLRAGVALARAAIPAWTKEDDRPRAAIEAAEAWLRGPGDEAAASCREANGAATRALLEHGGWTGRMTLVERATVQLAADAALAPDLHPTLAVRRAASLAQVAHDALGGGGTVRAAISVGLLPWALERAG